MSTKKTVVLGASPNASRYSNLACRMLHNAGFEFVPVSIKQGEILGKPILDLRTKPLVQDTHTVTLYIGPSNQSEWYDYIFSLNPQRIIFNPGSENPEFKSLAERRGIEAVEACNLVLIQTRQF
jgi:predicted CoA-binding protein